MDQQLTINKSIVSYFVENLPTYSNNEAIKIIDLIEQNLLVSDVSKKYLVELDNEIELIEDELKRAEIKKLFEYWINHRSFFVDFNYNGQVEEDVKLALNSIDQIYFNPFFLEKQRRKCEIKYPTVEAHSKDTFLKPEYFQRLKHLPTTIPLNDQSTYDISIIIKPFLKNSKTIVVIDPYLPNENASRNLFLLFDLFIDKNITLVFFSEKKYATIQIDKNGVIEEIINEKKLKRYAEFLNILEEKKIQGLKITLEHFHEKKHIERHILTEGIQIYLPGGLDFLDDEGKPNLMKTQSKKYDIKEIIIKNRTKAN